MGMFLKVLFFSLWIGYLVVLFVLVDVFMMGLLEMFCGGQIFMQVVFVDFIVEGYFVFYIWCMCGVYVEWCEMLLVFIVYEFGDVLLVYDGVLGLYFVLGLFVGINDVVVVDLVFVNDVVMCLFLCYYQDDVCCLFGLLLGYGYVEMEQIVVWFYILVEVICIIG